jgi:hypothetical protein
MRERKREVIVNKSAKATQGQTATENVGEYVVPVDPATELECDSCQ